MPSDKEQDELPAVYYDFLYKDPERLSSLYAQAFSGRLMGFENLSVDQRMTQRSGKASVYFASGDATTAKQSQQSHRESYDPHDLAVTDILSHLANRGFIHQDLESAPHGSLVHGRGTIFFMDRTMFDLAVGVCNAVASAERQKKAALRNRQTLEISNLLSTIMPKIVMPSAFALHNGVVNIVGCIKDSGMTEPVSTYYFRHGTSGLTDVSVIGIKEICRPDETSDLTVEPTNADPQLFIDAAKMGANTLFQLLFPPEAMRMTPLAIFREIKQSSS